MEKEEILALLKKYIQHVNEEEGITFICRIETDKEEAYYDDSIIFTEKEANFLRNLEKELVSK